MLKIENFARLYYPHFTTFRNETNFVMLFHAVMEFCLDLLRSKFWLIGDWSIGYQIFGLDARLRDAGSLVTTMD
jgi:hypothetical protein